MNPPAQESSASTPPAALIERLRAQDPDAFEALVKEFAGRMLGVARRFMRNEDDAQDALQDAFIQAYKALPRFEGRSSLATWLHSLTVRACLMRLRSRRSRHETPIESLLPQFKPDGHQTDAGKKWKDGPADAISAEERSLIRNHIDKLPEDYRNILLLRDIEEMDTRAVAEQLEISESLVKTRLHRARQALRTLLAPYFERA